MARSKTKEPEPREAAKVSVATRKLVLHEAGYLCGNPACRNLITLDVHHIEHVGDGGSDDASNLLPLCPNCHARHHRTGEIPVASVRAWKHLLISLNEAYDRRSVDALLAMERLSGRLRVGRGLVVSGDAVLRYGALVAGGLLTVTRVPSVLDTQLMIERQSDPPPRTYELEITERGRRFVAAWRAGDQVAALEALAGSSVADSGEARSTRTDRPARRPTPTAAR